MSQLSKTSFGNLYGTTGTTFPDNTTGDISEGDMRTFGDDILDSALFIEDNFVDEDDMASNSATKAPSQQSVKAYVDTQIASGSGVSNTDLKTFEQDDWIYTGVLASTGWQASVSGAGAGTGTNNYGEDATEQAMGTFYASTGTTTTGYVQVYKGYFRVGISNSIRLRFRMALANLSDATDTYTFRVGLSDGTGSGDPTNGIFFRYTHGTNSGEFEGVCRASSVETTVDTNIAATTTYKILGMTINAAGTSVQFDIDGANTGSAISTNIPTGVNLAMFFKITKSAGTTARLCHIDWHDLLITRTTAR